MVLLITNKEDITVDFIVQELQYRGIPYYRLNTEDIPEVIDIDFSITESGSQYWLHDKKKGVIIDLLGVSAVYFRRPQISDLKHITNISSEERLYLRSEMAFVLEGIYKTLREAFWINNVFRIREAENKLYQLQLAKQIGFDIPNSIISNTSTTIKRALAQNNSEYIIKPIKSGNVCPHNGSKIIFTSQLKKNNIQEERVASFPVYIQNEIEKACDIRCIVVKDQVYAAKIDSQISAASKVDWRHTDEFLPHERIRLPEPIQEKALKMTHQLGLTYSAIDFVIDKQGNYIFLECNPNGQWAWIEKRLDYPISKSIVDVLIGR